MSLADSQYRRRGEDCCLVPEARLATPAAGTQRSARLQVAEYNGKPSQYITPLKGRAYDAS